MDRVRVGARVRLGLVYNSVSPGYLFLSIFGQYEHWPKYVVFIWYVSLLLCKTTKICIFRREFYKKCSKSQFHDNMDENLIYVQFGCHVTTSPCDMYIHLHTIGLTGVTELGTVTFHFAPNRRRFHWSISRWTLLLRKNIFGKRFQSSLSLFVPSFRIF